MHTINRRIRSFDEGDWLLEGYTRHPRFSHGTMAWIAVGGAVLSAGTSIYSTQQQKKAADKALDAQRGIADNLKYEPIDIEKLKAQATATAIQNATQSLALERELSPDIAAIREELPRQIRSDLESGGTLPTDTVQEVTQAGRVVGARSGSPQSAVPLTAGLLGLSSIDLMNQRRAAAGNLLSQSGLPTVGLDPGDVASAEVAQNAAQNPFNLEKAGVSSNLAQSEANARGAQIGGQAGIVSSLGNLARQIGNAYVERQPGNYDALLRKVKPTNVTVLNQNPSTNPLMSGSPLGLA